MTCDKRSVCACKKSSASFRLWCVCWLVVMMSACPLKVKAQVIRIELSGGLQYFPGMTKKIGWDYNLAGRCMVTDNWFAAALVHGGFSKGTYPGVYANEATSLKHNQDASFMGVGAGYLHPVNDHLHAYAQLLGGWGAIETTGNPKQKIVTEVEGHEFKGFSAASVLGIDYYLPSSGIWGADVVIHYIDGHVMPSINLKYGINFDL